MARESALPSAPKERGGVAQIQPAHGLVFIVSGPSGVGKDAIKARLQDQGFPITFCVTATSRAPRPGEIHGVHYYFITEADFERMDRDGELLEHAKVHGRHHYGIPLRQVRDGLALGRDLLMTVDVQGGDTVRRKLPQAITIFVAPPDLESLVPRLASRGTEPEEERQIRLATAALEMEKRFAYDYLVVNEQGRLDEAVDKIKAIITAERCRVNPSTVDL